jgi:hypothetical protein
MVSCKNPVFVGPVFGLKGDFWPVFDQFRWFPEFPSFPFYQFTSFFRFQVPGSACFLVPMVKVPSEQFKCGRIITPLTGFLAPFWRSILSPFLPRLRSRICLFYWVFCTPEVISGPYLGHQPLGQVPIGKTVVDFSVHVRATFHEFIVASCVYIGVSYVWGSCNWTRDFSGHFWTPFLRYAGAVICLYIGVSCLRGVGRDPFSDHFWTLLLPVFLGTLEPHYRFCRTKIPWTCI